MSWETFGKAVSTILDSSTRFLEAVKSGTGVLVFTMIALCGLNVYLLIEIGKVNTGKDAKIYELYDKYVHQGDENNMLWRQHAKDADSIRNLIQTNTEIINELIKKPAK